MSFITRKLTGLVLALCVTGSAISAQTSVNLTLAEARALARQALFAGDSALALDLARAVLSQVPDDRASLIIVAAAAPQQGDTAAGRRAGARAFALSQTNEHRYEAARLTALAAAEEDRFTLATYWLRRALIVAPDDAERAQTRADGNVIRRLNPWSFDLSASLVPSSNVNGGAAGGVAAAPGTPTGSLSDSAQALAGWRGTLGLGATYRLQESATRRTLIGTQYQGARIRITDAANVPDEALATDEITVNLRHDRALGSGSIGAQLSYAMVDYRDLDNVTLATEVQKFDVWRLDIDRRLPIGDRSDISLMAGRSWTSYDQALISDVVRTTFGAAYGYGLQNRDQIHASISYADATGGNANYTSTEWTAQIRYSRADPIGPLSLNLSGGASKADFPDYSIGPFVVAGGRQDRTLFYGATIGFPDVSYAGFTPVLNIAGSHTDSNVTRFTRDNLSAGITIKSEF
ncbi:hypothetical protein [Yoonia sp.]|uniref:hypothetical protein n=1 Tax=Yoonia sp. TaxID=2212373 RepID=UPI0040471E07